MSEEWRDVVGYEGVYLVSNQGRVQRIGKDRGAVPGRILKQFDPPGLDYRFVAVSVSNKARIVPVHRLVAEAFVGARQNGLEVNHINGVHDDNRPENLEWVTHQENQRHAQNVLGTLRHPVMIGTEHPGAKLTDGKVLEIRNLGAMMRNGKRVYSNGEIGRQYGVSNVTVSLVLRRKLWTHV